MFRDLADELRMSEANGPPSGIEAVPERSEGIQIPEEAKRASVQIFSNTGSPALPDDNRWSQDCVGQCTYVHFVP